MSNTGILIKDTVFQRGVSYMMIGVFLLYNIMNKSIDYEKLGESFPQLDNNAAYTTKGWIIFWHFFKEVIKIHIWMFLTLLIIYVILFIFQILVLFVLKFDASLFQKLISGDGNALGQHNSDSTKEMITPMDIWKMMFSSLSYNYGIKLYLKLLFSHILVALLFSIYVATPKKMNSKKNKSLYMRLFYLIMFVETIFFYTLFLILNGRA